ncbi:flippase [Thermochromatium tepidum]|uniref:Oligosaccharide flippase family protein n=1 Tax=Thermochromatium tepidum ATCC 43061 TaxID=316276 RepID=A0A6I6E256_THETI|nr:flippase [Thermochromatium tepidum]QGU31762.1 oligosaccharide flippase family protein [Thermochromatium tepidum ATCC 43061]
MTTPCLRTNIAAMGVVQISNYVIPLITLPYLTRVLGAEAFGKVAFAQVVMTYFVLLVDYGFSWSATRKVAANRSDPAEVNRIFAATWVAQWLLVLLAAVIAAGVIMVTDRLRPDAPLYAAAFITVIASALFPIWFLQGLERLQVVAALQLLTRGLALIPIFLLIRQPSDAIWVLIIQGGAAMLAGVLSLWWIHRQSIVAWYRPRWPEIRGVLREGGALFGSRVSISLYTTLVPLVLGWVAGPVALAYFNLADKLRSAAQSLLVPLSQALFPRMSHLVQNDGEAAYTLIKRSALAVVLIAGSASLSLWALSDWLILLLGGQDFAPAAQVLRWLAPLPLVIGLSNVLGVQIMLPHGINRGFNLILASAAAISLLLIGPMAQHWGAPGAAQTMLLVELWVTGSMAVLLWRKGYLSALQWRNT